MKTKDNDELNELFYTLCQKFIAKKSKQFGRRYKLVEFAEHIGERTDVLSKFLNGDTTFSFEKINILCSRMNYNVQVKIVRNRTQKEKKQA